MIVGGCDIGSATGKAVVMKDGEVVSYAITPSTVKPEVTARKAMDEALQKAGLSRLEDLDYVVGTGYGRLKVDFANENVSENMTPDDVSDIPHDGRIAARGRPKCPMMLRNRRAVRGTIASPPLRMNRNGVKSNCPGSGSSASRSAMSPNAKLGAHVLVTR